MFCITTQRKPGITVVTFDGRLADADVAEVHRVLSELSGVVALSLCDLETCSNGAAAELRQWIEAGYTIQGATPYMKMLLSRKPQRPAVASMTKGEMLVGARRAGDTF